MIVANCSFKKVVKHHGVPFLEKKQQSLIINKSNKNDIIKILGNPSTTSKFDNDVWIYIERKQTQSELKKLGRMKISTFKANHAFLFRANLLNRSILPVLHRCVKGTAAFSK